MAWKYLGAAALAGGLFYGITSVASTDGHEDLGSQGLGSLGLGAQGSEGYVQTDLDQQSQPATETVSPATPVGDVGVSQSAAIAAPRDAGSAAITITDLDQLKDRYRDLTQEEITQEISDFEAKLRDADMIARANAQQLSASEMQELSDILQNLDALRLIKLERKLDAITARLKNRPVISTDELP